MLQTKKTSPFNKKNKIASKMSSAAAKCPKCGMMMSMHDGMGGCGSKKKY